MNLGVVFSCLIFLFYCFTQAFFCVHFIILSHVSFNMHKMITMISKHVILYLLIYFHYIILFPKMVITGLLMILPDMRLPKVISCGLLTLKCCTLVMMWRQSVLFFKLQTWTWIKEFLCQGNWKVFCPFFFVMVVW